MSAVDQHLLKFTKECLQLETKQWIESYKLKQAFISQLVERIQNATQNATQNESSVDSDVILLETVINSPNEFKSGLKSKKPTFDDYSNFVNSNNYVNANGVNLTPPQISVPQISEFKVNEHKVNLPQVNLPELLNDPSSQSSKSKGFKQMNNSNSSFSFGSKSKPGSSFSVDLTRCNLFKSSKTFPLLSKMMQQDKSKKTWFIANSKEAIRIVAEHEYKQILDQKACKTIRDCLKTNLYSISMDGRNMYRAEHFLKEVGLSLQADTNKKRHQELLQQVAELNPLKETQLNPTKATPQKRITTRSGMGKRMREKSAPDKGNKQDNTEKSSEFAVDEDRERNVRPRQATLVDYQLAYH